MKFSVITPVHAYDNSRIQLLLRASNSVQKQTFRDFEHVVINDGSTVWADPQGENIKVFKKEHLERIIATNLGFKKAKGEWICLLDSDDEYLSYYLEACNKMIEKYPDYKVFNFGSLHISQDYKARPRDAFKPKVLENGHEVFGGGTIVKGTFIFKKECIDKLGGFPEQWNPWDFSIEAQKEFPEIKQFFMVNWHNEPEKIAKELGNPWGDDYYLFYKLTREYHSMPIDAHLYLVHPSRREHQL